MTYHKRLLSLVALDSLIVIFSIYVSHFFLYPYDATFNKLIFISSAFLLAFHHIFSYAFGLYRNAWRYASINDLHKILLVVTLSISIVAILQMSLFSDLYQRALIVTWMLHILLIGGVRFSWRFFNEYISTNNFLINKFRKDKRARLLIVGAGSAGRILAKQLLVNNDTNLRPIVFVDDNRSLHGLEILGLPVSGPISEIEHIVSKYDIEHIVVAIPSASRQRQIEVIKSAQKVCDNVQTIPMIEELALGKVSIQDIKNISVDELLGRETVMLDINGIASRVKNRTVLVTGAGGSIGSELCRQLCKVEPKEIVLLGHGENSIYDIELELIRQYPNIQFHPVICDIQDRENIFDVIEKFRPAIIYHAAAHKHVPMMEKNPREAVKNNILGTKNVAEAADTFGVEIFVLISSDKAVNPTSIMGATKKIAENVIQTINKRSFTRFAVVRFGNVLGSRGSVIPLFKEQIKQGGPVTVTHPEMIRYFMTIPEASRLVIQASVLAKGGEIFLLDMGEPVKIVDLARNLIRLSGFNETEIPIVYTGIRPGEKMYEELLNTDEIQHLNIYPKIHIGKSNFDTNQNSIYQFIDTFRNLSESELKNEIFQLASNNSRNQVNNVL